jgi:hypothetical protein
MVEFNREHYDTLATDEDRAVYMTECFGDDQEAKDAAVA